MARNDGEVDNRSSPEERSLTVQLVRTDSLQIILRIPATVNHHYSADTTTLRRGTTHVRSAYQNSLKIVWLTRQDIPMMSTVDMAEIICAGNDVLRTNLL